MFVSNTDLKSIYLFVNTLIESCELWDKILSISVLSVKVHAIRFFFLFSLSYLKHRYANLFVYAA